MLGAQNSPYSVDKNLFNKRKSLRQESMQIAINAILAYLTSVKIQFYLQMTFLWFFQKSNIESYVLIWISIIGIYLITLICFLLLIKWLVLRQNIQVNTTLYFAIGYVGLQVLGTYYTLILKASGVWILPPERSQSFYQVKNWFRNSDISVHLIVFVAVGWFLKARQRSIQD